MSRQSIRDRRWSEVIRPAVLDRDGHQCVACGTTDDLTVDHIVPVDLINQGEGDPEDTHNLDNLVTLCRSCNSRKGNRRLVRLPWYSPRWLPNGLGFLAGEPEDPPASARGERPHSGRCQRVTSRVL